MKSKKTALRIDDNGCQYPRDINDRTYYDPNKSGNSSLIDLINTVFVINSGIQSDVEKAVANLKRTDPSAPESFFWLPNKLHSIVLEASQGEPNMTLAIEIMADIGKGQVVTKLIDLLTYDGFIAGYAEMALKEKVQVATPAQLAVLQENSKLILTYINGSVVGMNCPDFAKACARVIKFWREERDMITPYA